MNTRKGYKAQGKALPTLGTDSLVIIIAQGQQAKALASSPLVRDAIKHGKHETVTYKRSIFGALFNGGK